MGIEHLAWENQVLVYGLMLAIVSVSVGWWVGHRERVRLARLVSAKFRTLASLAQNTTLEEKLTDICALIEDQIDDALCSVMLVDNEKRTLSAATALSLPHEFTLQLQGLPIANGVGGCGTSAYLKVPVIVPDMTKDERFVVFKELIDKFQLKACWSYPVISPSQKGVIGTFAVYFRKKRRPTLRELDLLQRSRDLVALVIDQHNDRLRRERSEQHNRSLFTYNPEVVFTLDLDGNFMSLNRAALDLVGYDKLELLGNSFEHVVLPEDLARTNTHFEAAKKGKPQRYEIKIYNRSGELKHLDITNMPIIIDGEITGVHGIAKDVTTQRYNESQLKILERSVESSNNGVVISDANKKNFPIVYVNPAFKEITGYNNDEEFMGKSCNFLQGPETDPDTVEQIRHALKTRSEVRVTIRNYRKDGTPFWNELLISPVRDGDRVTHFIGLQSDITERVEREEALAFMANHDVLTGLPNRNALEAHLENALHQSSCPMAKVYVLFIDLDGFKPINDSLGHAIGDQILVETVERLKQRVGNGDMLARFGGDEFVAVVTSVQNPEQVNALVDDMLAEFHEPYRLNDIEVSLSATVGIATNSSSYQYPVELIQRADVAMYEAKRRGGSSWHWYSSDLDEGMQEQVELRTQLQEAILKQQFELFYQPIVDTDGKPRAAEALIRWNHPKRGYISPASFIPLAEATGQIIAMADWVFEQACQDVERLVNAGIERISVNFSPLQFYREDFIKNVEATMKRNRVEPGRIVVEITENVFLRDSTQIIALINQMRSLGLRIAIDDFGTGFASLSYLNELPIDEIKIDRSFISGVNSIGRNSAITRGVLMIAKEIGVQTVAEGVETLAERNYVVEHGTELMQGYLFCRPQPLETTLHWIIEQIEQHTHS